MVFLASNSGAQVFSPNNIYLSPSQLPFPCPQKARRGRVNGAHAGALRAPAAGYLKRCRGREHETVRHGLSHVTARNSPLSRGCP
jgi:hypothetical protein